MTPNLQKPCQPPFLRGDRFDENGVAHGFFGRKGGVSVGFNGSLNVSFDTGDSRENVVENKRRVANALGFASVFEVNQVHGIAVAVVDEKTASLPTADAIVTKTPGVLLTIRTADCAPILLSDPVNGVVAAIHAGWRGATLGIVAETVKKAIALGAEAKHINAIIGPCVQKRSFEVGSEVKEKANADEFFELTANGRFLFDLPGYLLKKLKDSGVSDAEAIRADTYALEDDFFSFRRSTHKNANPCGRQASCVGIRGHSSESALAAA